MADTNIALLVVRKTLLASSKYNCLLRNLIKRFSCLLHVLPYQKELTTCFAIKSVEEHKIIDAL